MKIKMRIVTVLHTVFRVQRKHQKDYSYPSQQKIIDLIKKFLGVKISRSTLNRWLRVAEDEKFVKRTRRIKKDKKRGTVFKSTIYKILIKGYYLMQSMGINCSKEIAIYLKWKESIKPKSEGKTPKNKLDKEKKGNGFRAWVKEQIQGSIGSLNKVFQGSS